MNQKVLAISSLPNPWKKLIRRCHDLWFGDLIDCQVEQGNITRVDRFVKSVLTKPLAAVTPFSETLPISTAWQTVMANCRKASVQSIPVIKIESGEPVRICIDEGGWTTEIK